MLHLSICKMMFNQLRLLFAHWEPKLTCGDLIMLYWLPLLLCMSWQHSNIISKLILSKQFTASSLIIASLMQLLINTCAITFFTFCNQCSAITCVSASSFTIKFMSVLLHPETHTDNQATLSLQACKVIPRTP